jgi:hypothetical protein
MQIVQLCAMKKLLYIFKVVIGGVVVVIPLINRSKVSCDLHNVLSPHQYQEAKRS